ncbi:flagellar filament capping protein FliD [Arcobacter ellisii]|uniref:Flagellar hook-associated protein 2 n=1 Tax=Arcobacter ellisii TaxID=913109 RepID=A0A347U5C2_9BACT|nr:flagellar filament capping protein FliD [Arcobacter ellisii]AXX94050.1 flagellar filament cap protein [Arcobacter ellisii]RXI32410.1 flagellar hook protein FliD [Arcobacter ellisii]
MAEGILGLGSGQASALNSDLIEKLKTAERKSTVEPYETKIENITTEKEVFANIQTKVSELLETIKPFDLFVSGGVTAFEQKSATTSGDSVTFDAADVKSLNKGFTSVEVTQLAQKDVYQSNTFNAATKDTAINQGDLVINGQTFDTTNKTYEQLATEITAKTGMNAAVDQVGSDSYRLVIKSEDTGIDNKLTISGAASQALGYTTDGTVINSANHILEAKNLIAKVDGVTYDVASNSITVDGLKITANKEGTSTINVVEDTTQVETQMQNFITKYNELVALVDSEAYNADSKIADKSAIRDIVNQVKTKLFGSYGENGDKSVFNFGIELAKDGGLSLDSKKFNEAVQNDITGLKDLFLGSAENKGLGTLLKETLDEMKFSGGLLNTYETSMTSREKTLNDEKDKAEEALNKKYELLALQFSSYGAIINQMEASFSGLKMLIQQSTSGN